MREISVKVYIFCDLKNEKNGSEKEKDIKNKQSHKKRKLTSKNVNNLKIEDKGVDKISTN